MARTSKTQPDVLTLPEAAKHLRLPEKDVQELAAEGSLPGRCVKQQWRFLRAALDDWLRAPDYKAALLRLAGASADDPSLPELRRSIARARRQLDKELDGKGR
jgi:excisionase family DNA binding protein